MCDCIIKLDRNVIGTDYDGNDFVVDYILEIVYDNIRINYTTNMLILLPDIIHRLLDGLCVMLNTDIRNLNTSIYDYTDNVIILDKGILPNSIKDDIKNMLK